MCNLVAAAAVWPKRRDHMSAPPANPSVGPSPERRGVGWYQRVDEDDSVTTLVQHAADKLVPIVRTAGFSSGNPSRVRTGPPPQPRHDLLHAPTVPMKQRTLILDPLRRSVESMVRPSLSPVRPAVPRRRLGRRNRSSVRRRAGSSTHRPPARKRPGAQFDPTPYGSMPETGRPSSR